MDDVYTPHQWSEEDFVGWLSEAQAKAVEAKGGISATAIMQVDNTDGSIQLQPHMWRVLSGYDPRTKRTVRVVDFKSDISMSTDELSSQKRGNPTKLISGVEDGKVFAYPVPSIDPYYIKLHLMNVPPDLVDVNSTLVIEDRFHLPLLDWVKYRALMGEDADQYNPQAAAAYRQSFELFLKEYESYSSYGRRYPGTVAYGGL
jgi:hypothetical protein